MSLLTTLIYFLNPRLHCFVNGDIAHCSFSMSELDVGLLQNTLLLNNIFGVAVPDYDRVISAETTHTKSRLGVEKQPSGSRIDVE